MAEEELTAGAIAAIDAKAAKARPLEVGRLRWISRSGESDRRAAATAKLREIRNVKEAS